MPGCQVHNSQCSLECVARILSPLTLTNVPGVQTQWRLNAPDTESVKLGLRCRVSVHVTISQSEVGIVAKRPMRRKKNVNMRTLLVSIRDSRIEILTGFKSVLVCPGLHSSNPLSTNWLIRILNASLWAEQSHHLPTSHIQYFTSHRGGPGRRRMDSIKFYCPILPAP